MSETIALEEPKPFKWLFTSKSASAIWLVARVWLGYQWLHAGWEKITGTGGGTFTWKLGFTEESWLRTTAGLKGFAVTRPSIVWPGEMTIVSTVSGVLSA